MAEFLGQTPPDVGGLVDLPPSPQGEPSGFDAMGHPVPMHRRSAAYEAMRDMGIDSPAERWATVNAVADRLERDQPHEAMSEAMRSVDLTGAYRLLAHLLT